MGELVTLETVGGIGTIRLNRPPVNALNDQLTGELAAAARAAAGSDEVRAVIIYGGEKAFAAGADIKEMAEASYAAMATRPIGLLEATTLLGGIPKPVVAAITGYALGGGLEIALTADFRVAGEGARLGQPEILLGIIPGAGGTQRLPRLVGPARAKDLIFSGRMVKAAEAHAIGLVDLVVPDDAVYQAAVDMVQRYAAGPASRCARPSRPSTTASTWTWPPAWRSSGCSSPRCSAPRTSEPACAASWSTAPARPPSPAADPSARARGLSLKDFLAGWRLATARIGESAPCRPAHRR